MDEVETMRPATAPGLKKPNPIRQFVRTYLIERTLWRIPRDASVLDFCCGWGFYFTINPKAVGVDGDPDPIAYLRARGRDVRQVNVLEPLPFEDGRFSHVLAHDVLEHFEYHELERILDHIYRVLRPGGTFAVWVPNRKGFDFAIDNGHKLFVTAETIAALIGDRFTVAKNYPEPFPRGLGSHFVHNKEVFILRRNSAVSVSEPRSPVTA